MNLETSQPSSRLLRCFFHLYVRLFVKSVGSLMAGSRAGYAYRSITIPRFYPATELADIMEQAGFEISSVNKLSFGIAAIHLGVK